MAKTSTVRSCGCPSTWRLFPCPPPLWSHLVYLIVYRPPLLPQTRTAPSLPWTSRPLTHSPFSITFYVMALWLSLIGNMINQLLLSSLAFKRFQFFCDIKSLISCQRPSSCNLQKSDLTSIGNAAHLHSLVSMTTSIEVPPFHSKL